MNNAQGITLQASDNTQCYSNQKCDIGTGRDIQINGKKTESPEINLHTYGQLIFGKGGKNIQNENGEENGEETFPLTRGVGKDGQ